ncbi:MAG TPA: ABC transporter ATP-binding protein, partial [Candidatus Methanoperedens sp.]
MQGKIPVHALSDVSFDVDKGEFLSIVGPSGSGKSTFLSMIGLLDKPTSGSVFINGVEITKATDSQAPKIRREKIGFVFQHFNLIPTLSAFENVDIAMRFARVPKSKRKERAVELLTQMGLRNRMNHKPSELSGGEQQRVAIARAMANNPAIILADEPTGEVDTKTRDMIVELLRDLSEKGQTILIVTHDTSVSARTKRIIKMLDGKIESDTINAVGEIKTA